MATGQQFNLRWNNHTNNILQVFLEQLTNENLVDVTLSCQGQFLKAHKMILSACSPYFQELFRQHSAQHPVIILNGMKFVDIKLVIEFMYRGEIKVLETELDGLLAAAETLQVKGLSNVRNKYEKGDIQCADTNQQQQTQQHNDSNEQTEKNESSSQGTPLHLRRKRRKLSESPVITMNDYMDDDDLPATIKVEPPDIRDIDEEEPSGWESPKLVIDLPETNEQPKMNSVPQKSPIRINKPMKVGSPSEFGKARARFLMDFPQTGGTSASSSKDMLLPQLLTSPREKKSNAWHKRRAGKIPRPPNAFMIFANEWRRKLAFQHPTESNKEISVRLGVMWKNLPADTKEGYYTASRQADEEHKRKYPGYYYSPKEARMNKMHKHNLALARKGNKPVDALHLVKVSDRCIVFMGDVNESSPYVVMPQQGGEPKESEKKQLSRLVMKMDKSHTNPPVEEVIDDEVMEVMDGEAASTINTSEKSEPSESIEKTQTSKVNKGSSESSLAFSNEKPQSKAKKSDTEQE
ncbi:hypothetical protein L9F63_011071, partial [Diploptera punctata]